VNTTKTSDFQNAQMSASSPDVEANNRPKEHLEGFADFAHFIGSDETLSIYRRFASLGARNLTYLQAELQYLEQQLDDIDKEDKKLLDNNGTSNEKHMINAAARAWEAFSGLAEDGDERQKKKMELILRIREVMKLYGKNERETQQNIRLMSVEKATLRRSQILALGKPKDSLAGFTNWFRSRKPFLGSSWHLLDDEDDLMALKAEPDADRLSTFIQRYFGYYLRVPKADMPESWEGMYYFPNERVVWVVAILSVLLAAILLFGAILALYFVPAEQMGRRLIVVGCFTTGFAASIGLLTNAKRVEIFAATAA
jgi:hypothetical protein